MRGWWTAVPRQRAFMSRAQRLDFNRRKPKCINVYANLTENVMHCNKLILNGCMTIQNGFIYQFILKTKKLYSSGLMKIQLSACDVTISQRIRESLINILGQRG